jgi:hypothetical protein
MSGGGSRPGERRGGRKAGTPNKVTAELAGLARVHTAEGFGHSRSYRERPGCAVRCAGRSSECGP